MLTHSQNLLWQCDRLPFGTKPLAHHHLPISLCGTPPLHQVSGIENGSTHVPQHADGGRGATSGVGPHAPPCLSRATRASTPG